MSRKLCLISGRWLGVFALLWLVCTAVQAEDPFAGEGGVREYRLHPADIIPSCNHGVVVKKPQAPQLSSHWLGLECAPLSNALRSHLKLMAGPGLLVVGVAPNSPAENKLQPYDVLLSVNGELVTDHEKLIDAVQQSKDAELEFELIRGGEKLQISVLPAERPKVLAFRAGPSGRFYEVHPGVVTSGNRPYLVMGGSAAIPKSLRMIQPIFPHSEVDQRMEQMQRRIERLERRLDAP